MTARTVTFGKTTLVVSRIKAWRVEGSAEYPVTNVWVRGLAYTFCEDGDHTQVLREAVEGAR